MCFYTATYEEMIPSSGVLYMRRTGPYGAENYALMAQFKRWLAVNGKTGSNTTVLAVPLDDPDTTPPGLCRYDVCTPAFPVQPKNCGSINTRETAGGKYLIFQIEHTAGSIAQAWLKYRDELGRRGYMPDPARPVMERYIKSLVDRHLCELCVPIL
ncbi:MAG: DNA gyrase inhibitor [Oscillospiraceae bacterium]|nr:DNA gyrase inhibitor [Oscillospiraceae bacterium]MCI9679203.1 DNA gyrase inhibitor [Oscillospiraceae bacterium]